ncbi:hypothetical protein Tco_1141184, partial [Tanacetum coccineum]
MCYDRDSITKKNDSNVFQDINHLNFFDVEYPELPNDDERVEPKLNSDQRSQSVNSSSSVSSEDANTADFLVNFGNDVDISDNFFATQNEEVTTLEENIFSEGNLDLNPRTSALGVQAIRRSSRHLVFPKNYNDFVIETKVKYGLEKHFMHSPLKSHLKIAFKILRYLKSCLGLGIHIIKTSGMSLSAYSDADWAKCVVTRRSVTGYCVFLNNSLVSWKSKKQNTLSKSSTEAEYRALALVISEVIWILKILKYLNVENLLPVSLHCDSNSAIKITANLVESANQIADILTKALDTLQHKLFVENHDDKRKVTEMKILDLLEQRISEVGKHLKKAKEKMDINKGKEKMVMKRGKCSFGHERENGDEK